MEKYIRKDAVGDLAVMQAVLELEDLRVRQQVKAARLFVQVVPATPRQFTSPDDLPVLRSTPMADNFETAGCQRELW